MASRKTRPSDIPPTVLITASNRQMHPLFRGRTHRRVRPTSERGRSRYGRSTATAHPAITPSPLSPPPAGPVRRFSFGSGRLRDIRRARSRYGRSAPTAHPAPHRFEGIRARSYTTRDGWGLAGGACLLTRQTASGKRVRPPRNAPPQWLLIFGGRLRCTCRRKSLLMLGRRRLGRRVIWRAGLFSPYRWMRLRRIAALSRYSGADHYFGDVAIGTAGVMDSEPWIPGWGRKEIEGPETALAVTCGRWFESVQIHPCSQGA